MVSRESKRVTDQPLYLKNQLVKITMWTNIIAHTCLLRPQKLRVIHPQETQPSCNPSKHVGRHAELDASFLPSLLDVQEVEAVARMAHGLKAIPVGQEQYRRKQIL